MDEKFYLGEDQTEKYLRHLGPVPTLAEQVAIANDPELPADFRDEVRGDLLEIKEELARMIIQIEQPEEY